MDEKTLIGRALNMSHLIDYQEGAVVSREVLKQETGTITIFAFDNEQGLSEHTSPYNAFVYILEGEAEITIEGEKHKLGQGDFIIMPANKPHALHAVQKFKMLLVLIKT